MTELQIQFYQAQEQKRHNIAQEQITRWYNEASAATNQMNAETNRLNFGVNAFNARTNQQNMLVNSRNADTNAANAQTNYYNMLVNRQNANINQQNADTNAFNAATNRLNYSVNVANAMTNLFNAQTNRQNAQTQKDRLELDKVNSVSQRALWEADANYKNQTLQPIIDKYSSEVFKNLSGGGGSKGSSGAKGFITNSWVLNDMNSAKQQADGSKQWLESDEPSTWFGSMLSSPLYTTASFGRLAYLSTRKAFTDTWNSFKDQVGAMSRPARAGHGF